jgi:nitronate monooxygenase
MAHWSDDRIQRLFNIKLPIIQAPMAGSSTTEMSIAVAVAGGLGSLPSAQMAPIELAPFDDAYCPVVEPLRPEVVSFHFGLPSYLLLDRVRSAGAKIISSATTVREAVWLEAHGCDAVIAMGVEAGGHRRNFLTDDMSAQGGTCRCCPRWSMPSKCLSLRPEESRMAAG